MMAFVFWDAESVIFIDHLSKGQTISANYYSNLFHDLPDAIAEKRLGNSERGVIMLHDNALPHTSRIALQVLEDCGFEVLSHPHYSPGSAPSHYYLFPQLKRQLRGKKFATSYDVIDAITEWCNSQDPSLSQNGIIDLRHRWPKCVELQGNYVERFQSMNLHCRLPSDQAKNFSVTPSN
uniref:Transposase n=1 Tax=Plectus sambesii TaxID=2011161 RepID=A0A914XA06_9BILA